MVRRDSGINSLPQLTGKKVVTVNGGTQEANLRKIVSSVDVVTFETAPQALVALQQHKAAAFINDEVSLFDAYAKMGPAQKDFVILAQNVSTEPIAIGTPMPPLGARNIRNIKRADMKAHFNALRKAGNSVSQVNKAIKAAKAIFTYAFDSEYVTANIMQRYPKLQRVEGERRANRGIFPKLNCKPSLRMPRL